MDVATEGGHEEKEEMLDIIFNSIYSTQNVTETSVEICMEQRHGECILACKFDIILVTVQLWLGPASNVYVCVIVSCLNSSSILIPTGLSLHNYEIRT